MTKEQPTYRAEIFIAGPIDVAKQVCREFCMRGLCVTVEPTTFIYTGGEEVGVRVGLINYARFPSTPEKIFATATALAGALQRRMCQHSYSIVASDRTLWSSTRADDVWPTLCDPDCGSEWENLNATI